MLSSVLIAIIFFALVFEFINGFHDTANAIATTVYTQALPARVAILMAAVMNFLGALMSEKVAMTISKGLINVSVEEYVIIGALIGAIIWNLFTWWRGLPSSSSHALIGGLIGATISYSASFEHILWTGVLQKVIIPLVTSPLIGFMVGFLLMSSIFKIFAKWVHNKANQLFLRLQILSAAFMAFSHGNNDAQKTMGIITLALISSGVLPETSGVPIWVKIICAVTMALGTSAGGWKIMKTMGRSVTKLKPSSGFASELSAALVIESASYMGMPVSTTQVISASIMGTGTARRASSVKWSVAENIVIAWILTLPVTIILGGIAVQILKIFM